MAERQCQTPSQGQFPDINPSRMKTPQLIFFSFQIYAHSGPWRDSALDFALSLVEPVVVTLQLPWKPSSRKDRSGRGFGHSLAAGQRRPGDPGPVDFRPGLPAGRIDPQPVRPGPRHHRVHFRRRRRNPRLLHRPLPARAAARASARGAAAGLREQADRDRLDGGAGPDRLRPRAGHGPHPLGGERAAAAAAGGGQHAVRHGGRPPVVVGVHLRPLQRQEAAASPTANELHVPASEDGVPRPCIPDPEVRGRVPQLLGAPAGRQDRPDPGPHQPHVVPDGPARPVRRPVCRVLRHAARQHAHPRRRRFPERLRGLAGERAEAGRGRSRRAAPAGRRSCPSRASTATGCAALPPGALTRRAKIASTRRSTIRCETSPRTR